MNVTLNIVLLKNRMLADFYIPRLSNDMNIALHKNNLGGQVWYRSLDPVKNGINPFLTIHFWLIIKLGGTTRKINAKSARSPLDSPKTKI